ncbi:MAG: S8 family serine peptidase [Synechocystis sp.]|nr:S8 family serine peptidase [Synechocystis sp.]
MGGLLGSLALGTMAIAGNLFPPYLTELGINAMPLYQSPYQLSGRKIALGQLEIGRPVQFLWDKLGRWRPPYHLAGIFHLDQMVPQNRYLESHATMVAQAMVSNDKRYLGVAPKARLYATAVGPQSQNFQPQQCLAAQFLSQRNGGDLRAINLSYGESLTRDDREKAQLDGNALLSLCLDWLSQQESVLFVVAGNQGKGGIPIPTDHYNGLTIAYSTQPHPQGVYDKLAFANLSQEPVGIGKRLVQLEINRQGRRGVNLVAPGSDVTFYDVNGQPETVSGSSFAAPLVTGTIALLQEFGDRQLFSPTPSPHWTLTHRRPEVIKAVLINAAVKIKNADLGMAYTLHSKKNWDWQQTPAYTNPQIPLDLELGSGQLNGLRAVQQFQAGAHSPSSVLPAIAWDYGTISPQQTVTYSLAAPLKAGSFATATLVWNRDVQLLDKNNNQQYDPGESFQPGSLTNLDLFLIPASESSPEPSASITCASQSQVDNLEHFFCPIPQTGLYQIQVKSSSRLPDQPQAYALSWWTVTKTPAPSWSSTRDDPTITEQ